MDLRRRASTARFVASLLLAAAMAGCGASQITPGPATGSTAPPTGVLHIVATEGPTCPVQRVGGPACTRPYTGQLEVRSASGALIGQPATSEDGMADVVLPPGMYTVSAPQSSSGLPRLTQPVTVSVSAGGTATATLDFDTGIR